MSILINIDFIIRSLDAATQLSAEESPAFIDMLLKAVADPSPVYISSALKSAVYSNNPEALITRLPYLKRPLEDDFLYNLMSDAFRQKKAIQILSLFKEKLKVDFNLKLNGETLLNDAISLAMMDLPYYSENQTDLAFLRAEREKFFQLISYLINNGAKADSTNFDGTSPFHLIIRSNKFTDDVAWYESLLSYLLSKGCNVNATTHEGYTPIHQAAQSNDPQASNIFPDQQENFLLCTTNTSFADNKQTKQLEFNALTFVAGILGNCHKIYMEDSSIKEFLFNMQFKKNGNYSWRYSPDYNIQANNQNFYTTGLALLQEKNPQFTLFSPEEYDLMSQKRFKKHDETTSRNCLVM